MAKTPKQQQSELDQVIQLKRTMNPETGLPYTYPEIAKIMNFKSGMSPFRIVPKPMRDKCCPMCLRELEVETPS